MTVHSKGQRAGEVCPIFFDYALIKAFLPYRLWYDAVLDWGLNPGPPPLKASTIPLGYRGAVFNILNTEYIFLLTKA